MKHFFSKFAALVCVCAAVAACQPGGAGKAGAIKTPETSKLFEKRVDSISGVVSYALKYGAPDDNRQSLYFVTKSMTEDGRFLVFMYTEGNEKKGHGPRHTMVADLLKDVDAVLLEQRARCLEAVSRVVVSGGDDYVHSRTFLACLGQKVVIGGLCGSRGVAVVEDVAGNKQCIGLLGFELRQQPVQEVEVLGQAVNAMKQISQVPITGS